jgi:nicotinic acid mononucleotide adenylyltransferase
MPQPNHGIVACTITTNTSSIGCGWHDHHRRIIFLCNFFVWCYLIGIIIFASIITTYRTTSLLEPIAPRIAVVNAFATTTTRTVITSGLGGWIGKKVARRFCESTRQYYSFLSVQQLTQVHSRTHSFHENYKVGSHPPPSIVRLVHNSHFDEDANVNADANLITMKNETTPTNDDYSLERLRERMINFVNNEKAIMTASTTTNINNAHRLVVAIAGGGGHYLSTLQATPGASVCLLEGIVLYDRESYNQYVNYHHLDVDGNTRQHTQSASGLARDLSFAVASSSTTTTSSTTIQHPKEDDRFSYSSSYAAAFAADAARQRGLQINALSDTTYGHVPLTYHTCTYGIGVASSLRSLPTTSSPTTKSSTILPSVAYIHVSGPNCDVASTVLLSTTNNRTRHDEDIMISHCILDIIEYAMQCREDCNRDTTKRTSAGDTIRTINVSRDSTQRNVVIQQAAEAIISGKASVALLLPTTNAMSNSAHDIDVSQESKGKKDVSDSYWTALVGSQWARCLPPSTMVFPGSFHPPHIGHMMLAQASKEAIIQHDTQSCTDTLHSVGIPPVLRRNVSRGGNMTAAVTTLFELSITNADKAPLDTMQVIDRVEAFWNAEGRPDRHWGIILTNAPLFTQKVHLLHQLVISPPMRWTSEGSTAVWHNSLTFIIGTDTLVRLLDPKYYAHDNSSEKMVESIRRLPCRFVVGGRLEQSKNCTDGTARFISGSEEVEALPTDLHQKFILMPHFRVDVSSSEIRANNLNKT